MSEQERWGWEIAVQVVVAATTLAAVIVALWTSRRALDQEKRHREADATQLAEDRRLKAKAVSALYLEALQQMHTKYSLAVSLIGARDRPLRDRVTLALSEVAQLEDTLGLEALRSVEAFVDPFGKHLAKSAAGLVTRKRWAQGLLDRISSGWVMHDHLADYIGQICRRDQLLARDSAQLFYELAEIDQDIRPLSALGPEEKKELRSPPMIFGPGLTPPAFSPRVRS